MVLLLLRVLPLYAHGSLEVGWGKGDGTLAVGALEVGFLRLQVGAVLAERSVLGYLGGDDDVGRIFNFVELKEKRQD